MKRIVLEIHQTHHFSKKLQAMRKAGKIERLAAGRADIIIADLQTDPLHEGTECRRTHYGEQRHRACRKYDLSSGFRLVGLKRDSRLIFIYIGSHDDCQRWLENYREHPEEIQSTPVPKCDSKDLQEILPLGPEPEIDEYEEQLMAKIDKQMLRDIFAGLCKNTKLNSSEIT